MSNKKPSFKVSIHITIVKFLYGFLYPKKGKFEQSFIEKDLYCNFYIYKDIFYLNQSEAGTVLFVVFPVGLLAVCGAIVHLPTSRAAEQGVLTLYISGCKAFFGASNII